MFDKQIYLDIIKLQHMLGGESALAVTGWVCRSQPITIFCSSCCWKTTFMAIVLSLTKLSDAFFCNRHHNSPCFGHKDGARLGQTGCWFVLNWALGPGRLSPAPLKHSLPLFFPSVERCSGCRPRGAWAVRCAEWLQSPSRLRGWPLSLAKARTGGSSPCEHRGHHCRGALGWVGLHYLNASQGAFKSLIAASFCTCRCFSMWVTSPHVQEAGEMLFHGCWAPGLKCAPSFTCLMVLSRALKKNCSQRDFTGFSPC